MAKKGEKRDLDPGMMEYTGGSKKKGQPEVDSSIVEALL